MTDHRKVEALRWPELPVFVTDAGVGETLAAYDADLADAQTNVVDYFKAFNAELSESTKGVS